MWGYQMDLDPYRTETDMARKITKFFFRPQAEGPTGHGSRRRRGGLSARTKFGGMGRSFGSCSGGRCHVVPGTDLFAPWFVSENAGGYDYPNP